MTSGTSFMDRQELADLGFQALGGNARISRLARFYGTDRISIGDDVRIDDFAILSPGAGSIDLVGHVHIAAGAMLFGAVRIGEWSTLSSRVAVYGVSDDFRVDAVTYPHGDAARVVIEAAVWIGDRVVVGTGSTILPGVRIASGVAVGAMSLVTRALEEPGVYVGIPARWQGPRVAPPTG